ncbi:Hypothetical_protein [Hexamita inflata]|uniref:Hypothetical_protein n=1 Tax=Hexamita inflata TaxID=28002 RepID=A0AA86QTU7_9EUKA|nr:Hypothetical protein HINF_LOCUS31984 [Hexamita inflata]CAI9944342.1 Hypothetical protein HINF_LOCUS31987 [Hexamita inflata]CAI9964590.1 Hypothetical protein HINF_LOCUS52235 [Hexamita inflata]
MRQWYSIPKFYYILGHLCFYLLLNNKIKIYQAQVLDRICNFVWYHSFTSRPSGNWRNIRRMQKAWTTVIRVRSRIIARQCVLVENISNPNQRSLMDQTKAAVRRLNLPARNRVPAKFAFSLLHCDSAYVVQNGFNHVNASSEAFAV